MNDGTMGDARIATWTGRLVDPFALRPQDVDIHDIAHALSRQCRYGGMGRFYSTAEHSVLLCVYLHRLHGLGKQALMHDAHEAYLPPATAICPVCKNPVVLRQGRIGEHRCFPVDGGPSWLSRGPE